MIGALRAGVVRPGALEHHIDGISKKVLNERLAKLLRYGIVDKQSYPELPPRVEYRITAFGLRLCALLDGVDRLQQELDRADGAQQGPAAP